MPLCAVIANDHGRYFCTHGGISPDLTSLDQIAALDRRYLQLYRSTRRRCLKRLNPRIELRKLPNTLALASALLGVTGDLCPRIVVPFVKWFGLTCVDTCILPPPWCIYCLPSFRLAPPKSHLPRSSIPCCFTCRPLWFVCVWGGGGSG